MSLRQHFAVFRSFAWLIVLSVATAVTASIALTAIVPRLYEARATLSVGQSLGSEAIDYDDLLASQALGRTYARLATTQPLLSAVIERTGFEVSTSDLAKKVSTEVQPNDTLLTIAVRDPNAPVAADIANAVAAELVSRAPDNQNVDTETLRAQLAKLDATIATVTGQIADLSAQDVQTPATTAKLDSLDRRLEAVIASRATLESQLPLHSPSSLAIVDPAAVPDSPAGPGRAVIVIVAGAAALIVSVALAYAITSWHGEREPESGLAVAVSPEMRPGPDT